MGLPWQFAARFESFGVSARSNIFKLCAWKADLSIEWRLSQTNSLSYVVYCSGASRNQNETLCVLRASQALTRRTRSPAPDGAGRSISVTSVLWLFSRGAHKGTTDAWVSNHSKSAPGSVRLNKDTICDVQFVSGRRRSTTTGSHSPDLVVT